MKKIHIIALLVIAAAITIIVSTAGDASTYVNFTQAESLAKDGESDAVHVVGKLKKDASGRIEGMEYQPALDPNHFVFTLVDNDNRVKRVIYNAPKPQDFDRSEQIVVIGSMKGDHFQADKILLKCPSKYNDGKLETTEHEAKTAQL
ncbi:cytochrome c maturation protein CcmE domain-containing protein [Tellurirhabdus rosea]|uniref:cytochrome c maturation protein CcmE domain-containing protein n=1 Tax=Tellurirhabdus rosea TaxID=2674997 RepID=UPI00225A0A59|nr:cytochrome c maturation protein CcmE [Tellurirhabdus rosea]